ncbi:Hypothetical predicted protein [Xyrichtys novacula]|uniref:Uncharacterized protein n=1 Tax=Xyrichtys novacula TaxID=13765 RepID=A0AAV1GI74_XYRNO|nr:Hypothetical predicted protein [Xyrichtys novacula]
MNHEIHQCSCNSPSIQFVNVLFFLEHKSSLAKFKSSKVQTHSFTEESHVVLSIVSHQLTSENTTGIYSQRAGQAVSADFHTRTALPNGCAVCAVIKLRSVQHTQNEWMRVIQSYRSEVHVAISLALQLDTVWRDRVRICRSGVVKVLKGAEVRISGPTPPQLTSSNSGLTLANENHCVLTPCHGLLTVHPRVDG